MIRVLDANANRAREALRVMEDGARFVLDDAALSRDLKTLRHDLASAIRSLPPHVDLPSRRDTPGDVGTSVTTPAEAARADVRDVAVAAGKRLGESLRCLEEYGKLVSPPFVAAVKQLRYRGYRLEQRLLDRLGPGHRRQWRLCVIITESHCGRRGWRFVAEAALDAGADCIQLREKQLNDADLLARVRWLVERAAAAVRRGRPAPAVIVNDRPDVALLAGATGVHLGQTDLPAEAVRSLAGRSLLIGMSTHNLAEARRAVRDEVNYCGVGAMYRTETKRRTPSGIAYLKRFIARYPEVPHLVIGGITPDNLGLLIDAGARGAAVCHAVCNADRPDQIVRKLLRTFAQRNHP